MALAGARGNISRRRSCLERHRAVSFMVYGVAVAVPLTAAIVVSWFIPWSKSGDCTPIYRATCPAEWVGSVTLMFSLSFSTGVLLLLMPLCGACFFNYCRRSRCIPNESVGALLYAAAMGCGVGSLYYFGQTGLVFAEGPWSYFSIGQWVFVVAIVLVLLLGLIFFLKRLVSRLRMRGGGAIIPRPRLPTDRRQSHPARSGAPPTPPTQPAPTGVLVDEAPKPAPMLAVTKFVLGHSKQNVKRNAVHSSSGSFSNLTNLRAPAEDQPIQDADAPPLGPPSDVSASAGAGPGVLAAAPLPAQRLGVGGSAHSSWVAKSAANVVNFLRYGALERPPDSDSDSDSDFGADHIDESERSNDEGEAARPDQSSTDSDDTVTMEAGRMPGTVNSGAAPARRTFSWLF